MVGPPPLPPGDGVTLAANGPVGLEADGLAGMNAQLVRGALPGFEGAAGIRKLLDDKAGKSRS